MPNKATAPLTDAESAPATAPEPIATAGEPVTEPDTVTEPITAPAAPAAAASAPAQPYQAPVGAYQPAQPMYGAYVAPPPAPSAIKDPREFARRVLPFAAWFCLITSILAGLFCLIMGIVEASTYYGSGAYAVLGLAGLIVSLAIGLFAFAHLIGMRHMMEIQMYRPMPR
ncbi:MAG: hypothetical protein FWF36_01940 [Propionibacteriaceae bacterium]|nr:hypothetical protein [Propionibacteriaceae bacterium]